MLSPLLLAVASSYAGTALVGPKAMATNVSSWKDTAVRGHCGPTTEIGDCSAGASGSFGGRDWSSWSKAAHWCLQRCARCARCQFISVSLAERDCSWFASCSKLHDSPRIFRSGPAAAATMAAARRPPQLGQRRARASQRHVISHICLTCHVINVNIYFSYVTPSPAICIMTRRIAAP